MADFKQFWNKTGISDIIRIFEMQWVWKTAFVIHSRNRQYSFVRWQKSARAAS